MMKRRHRASDEIMLIPFLDILCSLIGVLILIIVVLCVAQTQKINGRTPEEIVMSQDFLKLLKQQKKDEETSLAIKERLAALEKLREESEEKQQKIARLRKLLDMSESVRANNKEMSQNLMKELDNLLLEVGGLTTHEEEVKKEIARLNDEIKKRQPPAQKVLPPVIVQPSGSGLAKGAKVFFVEASSGKLTVYWDEEKKSVVSAVPDVIAADVAFNAFLKNVIAVPQSKIVFLLRDDGMGAYNNGAGWAQATYGYRVDQIGKLPLPGRGAVDLKMFKDYIGTMPPPPEVKLVTPTPPAGEPPEKKPKAVAPPEKKPPVVTPPAGKA
jgi:biopolymer transport protein ExbD